MMTDKDILLAAIELGHKLFEEYPLIDLEEMNEAHKNSRRVPILVQVAHCKYLLKKVPLHLEQETQSSREKAFRWLSDAGGVMRSELHVLSVNELRNIFRPKADVINIS